MACPSPCAICPNKDRPSELVQFDGPDGATTLWIGEGPGFFEYRSKTPFVGKTGRELNHLYLPNFAHMSRKAVKIANAVTCFFDGDNQTADQARHCAEHNLKRQVQAMPNLRHVILMGAVACSILDWAAEDAETGDPLSKPNLMIEHGLPVNHGRPVNLFGRIVQVIGIIHPAAGLHQISAMSDIMDDFAAVKLMREGWLGPRDVIGDNVLYQEVFDDQPFEIEAWRRRLRKPVVSLDTELDSRRRPWCSQLSAGIGQGCMARVGSVKALEMMQDVLAQADRVLISFAKHDLPVVADMGLELDPAKVVDTVLLARQLGYPGSIKALARRLAGMEMDSWEEITWTQYEADCIEWILAAEALIGTEVERQEKEAHQMLREMAEALVPEDAKNRKALVNREFKQLLWQLEEERADTWRPPVEYYDRGGKPTRRRGAGFNKIIGRILGDHQRSLDSGNTGVDFGKRWFGEEDDDESPGTLGRLPVWVVKILRRELGDFPRRGLDQAPYDKALHYSCRDVDALMRVWPHLVKKAAEIEKEAWVV